ncbi:MAG TPA: hypothetical protein PKD78_07210 [Saprospiraceae bacterium]|nr:hypothetical protein [Saprospiraceae bacterium]
MRKKRYLRGKKITTLEDCVSRGQEHVQIFLTVRKRGNLGSARVAFFAVAGGYGEESQRRPERNMPLAANGENSGHALSNQTQKPDYDIKNCFSNAMLGSPVASLSKF